MVMHARKPQRVNDGYFEKHQSHSYQSSKYNSKRDYERNERVSNYRDRDISPGSGSVSLNNGNSYRSQSPEIDSPSSRGHGGGGSHDIRDRSDHRGGGGGGDRYNYIQKMRDRDRDLYKKEKYSDKRDRRGNDRDSESHRTNHDRGERRGGGSGGLSSKFCSSNDKRSGSDDRERERDRDRDLRDLRDKRDHRGGSDERKRDRERDLRDNERRRGGGAGGGSGGGGAGSNTAVDDKRSGGDRGERVARYGDWSEHVSSSGKMYYYNCKTEVSQWEKPKEWIERERNLVRDQHREKDYREKERDRERDDRFSRSAYTKHSSSRGNARLRWNYDNDGRPPTHRRRLDGRLGENVDMDISPGDSTPTSEASYSLSGTPTTHGVSGSHNNDQSSSTATNATGGSTVGLPNALPRLASHPNAISLSTTNANCASGVVVNALHCNATPAATAASGGSMPPTMLPTTGLASVTTNPVITTNNNHRKLDAVTLMQHQTHLAQASAASPNSSVPALNQVDHHLNSNAPGPPKLSGHKDSQQQHARLPQHSTQQQQQQHGHIIDVTHNSMDAANHAIRENALNSPLYNLTHAHGMSPLHYTRSPLASGGAGNGALAGHANSVPNATYSCNTTNFALKTVDHSSSGGGAGSNINASGINSNSTTHSNNISNSQSGNGTLTTCSSLTTQTIANAHNNSNSNNVGMLPGDGPPTPTQELDTSGTSIDQQQQRKMDGTSSATLSSLQSCVSSSVQAGRLQGPEISPKLAKYFRSDLIQHVTNWQADILEAQCQKLSEEAHLYGDLQCTKVSADLKCARSLVRITEITATLQEQRIMYLRQQIRRLEESKSQNSFMSDDL